MPKFSFDGGYYANALVGVSLLRLLPAPQLRRRLDLTRTMGIVAKMCAEQIVFDALEELIVDDPFWGAEKASVAECNCQDMPI